MHWMACSVSFRLRLFFRPNSALPLTVNMNKIGRIEAINPPDIIPRKNTIALHSNYRLWRWILRAGKVTPDQTAFGLRVARTGSSRVNPFSEDALSLFVIENNQLRAVLNGIVLENSTGEWDGNCVGTFHDIKRTLALAPDSHNGYIDIRVNGKNVESTAYTDANEQCASKDKPGKASWVLRYDGKQYAIPKRTVPVVLRSKAGEEIASLSPALLPHLSLASSSRQ